MQATYPFEAVMTEIFPDLSGEGQDFPVGMHVMVLGEGDSEELYLIETMDGRLQTDIEKTIVQPYLPGRKAFGPQRLMTAMQKARNVAESIVNHNLSLTHETWCKYGIQDNTRQQTLVMQAIQDIMIRRNICLKKASVDLQ